MGAIYRIAHIATDHCKGCRRDNIAKQDANARSPQDLNLSKVVRR